MTATILAVVVVLLLCVIAWQAVKLSNAIEDKRAWGQVASDRLDALISERNRADKSKAAHRDLLAYFDSDDHLSNSAWSARCNELREQLRDEEQRAEDARCDLQRERARLDRIRTELGLSAAYQSDPDIPF